MITGFNVDIEYQGKVYHLQTEDKGPKNPMILTILFHAGAILTTRKTSYADIAESGNLSATLKEIMNKQLKEMAQDLVAGRVPEVSGPGTAKPAVAAQPNVSSGAEPKPKKASSDRKSLDDMILDYLSSRGERKKP